jgi:hypothetical protein
VKPIKPCYEEYGKHNQKRTGVSSNVPRESAQQYLESSLEVPGTNSRVYVDPSSGDIFVFRFTQARGGTRVYHGYNVANYWGLNTNEQAIVRGAGFFTGRGKFIKK